MPQADKEFLIRVRADIQKAVASLREVSGEIGKTGDLSKTASSQTAALGDSLRQLATGATAYLVTMKAIQALRMVDEWNSLQQRIKQATKETGGFTRVSKELFDISQRNGAEIADTVATFQRLSTARKELKATNDEILKVTNAVQQLGILSGASGTAMQAGMLQFGQAMSSGVVRAEEFNSILENMPALAARIADGLGLTVGQLRQAVLNGEVLSRSVFDAILKQSDQIASDMEEMPTNMGRAWTAAGDASARFLANIQEVSLVGKLITQSIQGWAVMLNAYSDAAEVENMLPEVQQRRVELQKQINNLENDPSARNRSARLSEYRKELAALNEELNKRRSAGVVCTDGTASGTAPAVQSQKQLEDQIKATNKSLKDQTSLFEQQAKVVAAAQKQVQEFQSRVADSRRAISDQGTGPGVIGTGYDLLQAEGSLSKGDYQAALNAADKAIEAVNEMGRAGKVSKLALEGLLSQAERIGTAAGKGIEGQEQAKLDEFGAKVTDLLAKAEQLKALKVGFDTDGALAEAATLRAKLQEQFAASPLTIPTITTQIGAPITDTEGPGITPTTDPKGPGATPINGLPRTPEGKIQSGDKVIRYRVEVDDSAVAAQMAAANAKAQAAATPVVMPIVMTTVNGVPTFSNTEVSIDDALSDEVMATDYK
ncbi:MAG: tape measure protein [Chromatiaceae bacterium]|nr:tape measure protein [Chromatiaceae bacterium]